MRLLLCADWMFSTPVQSVGLSCTVPRYLVQLCGGYNIGLFGQLNAHQLNFCTVNEYEDIHD